MGELIFLNKTKISLSHFFNKYVAAHLGRLAPHQRKKRRHDFAVFAHDFIGIQINVFGLYEKEELENLFHFLNSLQGVFEKSLVLDIGANIGNHAVFFSEKFQKVIAFEPNPSTFYLLKFNTSQLPNITVFNFGLGNEDGSFKMSERLANKGGNSIHLLTSTDDLIEVQIKKLDDILIDAKDISLMKIDVEGFEHKVLKGGESVIKNYQPLILLEQLEGEFKDGLSQSIEFLRKLDYKFCWHVRGIDTCRILPRVLLNFWEVLFGRHQMVFTSDHVPIGNYPMLIAVPKRFQTILGMTT